MADDPDIVAGRAIAAGSNAAPAAVTTDPDIAAGRAIATAPPATVTATGPATQIPPPGQPSWTWGGVARNAGAGVLDAAGNVINVLQNPSQMVLTPLAIAGGTAYDFLAPKLGLPQMTPEQRADLYGQPQPGQTQLPPEQQQPGTRVVNALDPSSANLPATPVEQAVRTGIGGLATAAALGPGGIAPAVAGGVGGVLGNVAAQNVPDWLKPGAELVGNVVGATGTGVATAAERAARGAVTDVSAADAALGQAARDKYNIPIDANDLSSNSLYRIAADQAGRLPFSGAAAAATAKKSAWQGAIAKEMGEDATAFTPEVMDRARTRIGQTFDTVAKNTTIDQASTDTLTNVDLPKIEADMNMVLPTNELPKIKAQLENIIDVASKQGGTISGDSYQALTRKGAPLDLAESSGDSNVRFVAGQIRDALDDAFVRSASPADQAALVQAKYQYRVMRTVQDLAAGSRDGSITPAGFMQKVLTSSRRFDAPTGGIAYTGGGNIGELARIGQLMRAPPQTGTADRAFVNALTLGGGGGLAYLNPAYAAGVPAILAANRLGGAYLRSGFLANQVIQNALQPPLPSPFVLGAPLVTGSNPPQQSP
jgi:hypothetical protein